MMAKLNCLDLYLIIMDLDYYENFIILHGQIKLADVAKLVDAPDLGSGAARREGSSPFIRTE